MTEQEIVSYLKENRNQGIAYPFYPDAVKEWIDDHWYVIIEYCYNHITNSYHWVKHHDNEPAVASNDVYALPKDFELPPKPQSGWVEFEIKKGKFNFIPSDVNGLDGVIESWWNWQEFLTVSSKFDLGFTAFGGWQYESDSFWLTTPHVIGGEGLLTTLTNPEEDCKPAIPVKIRFWKENK